MDPSILRKIARDCFRRDRIEYPQSRVLSVAHDNDRSLLHKGRFYSPLIDTMEDDLRARGTGCISIARIISRIKGSIAYGRVYSPEGAFARALVTKRVKARFSRKGAYPFSAHEEAIWGDILDRTGARKLFGIQPSRELCVAARKRGVWVADVQHGVINHGHPWYGENYRGHEPTEYAPHAFVCWDAGSGEVIQRWAAPKGVETIVTGNRWLARFLPSRAPDPLVAELLRDYDHRRLNPMGKPSILVALSWGEVNLPNGFISDELCTVIRRTADRYHWSVRLHPNQLNGFATHEGRRFREFFEANLAGAVEWETASRAALPAVLRHMQLHICWNSSVSLEAAQMGVYSAMLDPRLRQAGPLGDYYADHRRTGTIQAVDDDASAIETWIERHLGRTAPIENFAAFDARYARLLDFLTDQVPADEHA
jgi:hypothetical protein